MPVIEFSHVTKEYHLGSRTSLRGAIAQAVKNLARRKQADHSLFSALDDVSFNMEQGEVLGIIGHNGAGKSTTLKLLSRVTYPTRGSIHTQGRVAALIELGAGFHPDLSGRENVYLNGSILGLKKREIDAQFSNMVEFAGLEKFIDTPVKRYSSGMYVRLAFAVAAHMRADILLVDEVLSVGDAAFQQKCMKKMGELRDSGATIVFVSHNMWSIESFCRRVIVLRKGKIETEGKVSDVVEFYRQRQREDLFAQTGRGDDAADHDNLLPGQKPNDVKVHIELFDSAGKHANEIGANETLLVRAHYHAPERVANPLFILRLHRADGLLCCETVNRAQADTHIDQSIHGPGTFEVRLGPLQLVTDHYTIEAHIVDSAAPIIYAVSPREHFQIQAQPFGADHGIFAPPVEWLYPERAR